MSRITRITRQEVEVPLAAHLRRLRQSRVRELHGDPGQIEHLAQVALGQAERGDDDRFVPIWELGPSGMWGAGGNINRDLAGFRGLRNSIGHELRSLGDFARIEPCRQWTPGEAHPNTLWFVVEGQDSLRCLRTAPEESQKDEQAVAASMRLIGGL